MMLAACGQPTSTEPAVDAGERSVTPSPAVADVEEDVVADVAEEVADDVASEPDAPTHLVPEPPASQPREAFLAPAERLVAIGDVHGDIAALRAALSVAMVIDADDHWTGGTTTVVQVGDQLDRGEDERAILHWLEELAEEAKAVGGAVYPMLGNHETMNVELDLRYVTEGGYADFADVAWDTADSFYAQYPDQEKGRIAAFRPGGPYAQLLARHVIALVVGDTAFVHGGLLPEHADYGLEAINTETRAWMQGTAPRPSLLGGDNSPVWSRHYSSSPDDADCALLFETLDALDVARMVVAHTVHTEGITAACQDLVWRVDVGLASYYGGPTQVLLIEGDTLTVLP
jgi:hypothetical protein